MQNAAVVVPWLRSHVFFWEGRQPADAGCQLMNEGDETVFFPITAIITVN